MVHVFYILFGITTLISGASIAYFGFLFINRLFNKKKKEQAEYEPSKEDLAVVDEKVKLNQEIKTCEACIQEGKFKDAKEHYAAVKALYQQLPKRLKKEFMKEAKTLFSELVEMEEEAGENKENEKKEQEEKTDESEEKAEQDSKE